MIKLFTNAGSPSDFALKVIILVLTKSIVTSGNEIDFTQGFELAILRVTLPGI